MYGKVSFLILAVILVCSGPPRKAMAQSGETAPKVSGFKTSSGVRIVSRDPRAGFSLEIAGRNIQPLSAKRLLWRVDDKEVEVVTVPRRSNLLNRLSEAQELKQFRDDDLRSAELSAWQAKPAQEFSSPSGQNYLYWSMTHSNSIRVTAATVNDSLVVAVIVTGTVALGERDLGDYVKRTALSLKRDNALEPEVNVPSVHETGATLQHQLALNEALLGVPHVALLNADLATDADKELRAAIPLDSATLVELARFMIEIDGQRAFMTTDVFDGQSSHAINLTGYDRSQNTFAYWDPWGKGSFLARGFNQAGIAAVPHPSQKRIWLVKYDELRSVLYAIPVSEDQLLSIFRLCTQLTRPANDLVRTYQSLGAQRAHEVADDRLQRITEYLLREKQFSQAAAIARLRFTLYPATATEKPQLLARLRSEGAQTAADELAGGKDENGQASPVKWRLEVAKNTDFFTFFHLQQIATNQDANQRTVVSFRPSALSFHDLVELKAALGNGGEVVEWTLSLAKRFVKDGSTSIFAGDITKSFLTFAIAADKNGPIDTLVKEVWQPRNDNERFVPVPAAKVPNTHVPAVRSPAYLAYWGTEKVYEEHLNRGMLRIQNVSTEKTNTVTISVIAD